MKEIGGKKYCSICYATIQKEFGDREKLFNYISEVYKIKYPTGKMISQIKNYRNKRRGYSYENMKLTLEYAFRAKPNLKPILAAGVGLIPYLYDECVAYFEALEEKRKSKSYKKTETKTQTTYIDPKSIL